MPPLHRKDSGCIPARYVIAMADSVGGLNALSVLLGGLPADFSAAIAIVMHLSPVFKVSWPKS